MMREILSGETSFTTRDGKEETGLKVVEDGDPVEVEVMVVEEVEVEDVILMMEVSEEETEDILQNVEDGGMKCLHLLRE